MVTVIKHLLRAGVRAGGGFRLDGWAPRLSVTLLGPSHAGAELVWGVARPDGNAWFEHRVAMPELEPGQSTSIDLQRWEEVDICPTPGTAPFILRLVSELDGVDELLHHGSITVVALAGDQRYAVDHEWMLGRPQLCLDTLDEPDAPRLCVTTFIEGAVDSYEFEAHCFADGARLARASTLTSRHTFTANDGVVVGQLLTARFDDIRGWNNLSDSGWGSDWHLLDRADATYDIKLAQGSAVVRTISFSVADGRITAPARIETDPFTGPVLLLGDPLAEPHADALDEPCADARAEPCADARAEPLATSLADAAYYGDATTAAHWLSLDDIYALRTPHDDAPVDATPNIAAEARATPAPVELDDDLAAALQAYVDRAERLILTWETDLVETPPPFDHSQVLAAEAVQFELSGYVDRLEGAADVPDTHPASLSGEPVTVGDLRSRMRAIFAAADARIGSATQAHDDALAPYRALLHGDKLALFEDHPANSFQYFTTDRRIIETPEDLAAAEFWYFEGPLDSSSTASSAGLDLTVTSQGWRVLGWQFDPTGTIVHEFETQGPGPRAPRSAFQNPATPR